MFCVVYNFTIKEGMNAQFEKSWADFTEAIYRERGSLGSRLHRTDDPQAYVAYAQWPSKEIFNEDFPIEKFSKTDQEARQRMTETLNGKISITNLEVCDDRLRSSNA